MKKIIILIILLVLSTTSWAFDSAYSGAQVDASVAAHVGRNTTVADPGSDAELVTEQAVREALNAKEDTLTNSAGLRGALSDETGTGIAVFGTSPTFTTNLTTPQVTISGADAVPNAAGELRYDSIITGMSGGGLRWFDDNSVRLIVDLETDPSSDDYVVSYDAAADGFYMKVDATGAGGSGSVTTLKENDVQVGGADIVTIDFLGADFDLAESPDTEVQVVIAAALMRDAEWTTATTGAEGKVELATNAETVTGTDTTRAVTPDGLTDKMAAPGAIGNTTPATSIAVGSVTDTEFDYLDGVTSAIQTQLDTKEGTLTNEAGLYSALSDVTQFVEAGDAATLLDGTAWRVFYSNTSGDVTELALGADGTYLRSNGAAAAPTFTTPAGSGDFSGPASSTDNAVVRFNGAGGKTGQNSGITVDDSNNVAGMGTLACGAITSSADMTIGSGGDPADSGTIRLKNADSIQFEASPAGTDVNALSVDSSEVVQIGSAGSSGVTITPTVTITGDLVVSGGDLDFGNIAVGFGTSVEDSFTFNTDGTGTAEIALPSGSIDSTEVLDGEITEADLNATNAPGAGEDNYVLTYNHAGTNFTWAADATGGNTALHDIGDPTAATSITCADGETITLLSSSDNEIFLNIQDDDAALAAATTLIDLNWSAATYDGTSDAIYLNMQDYTTTAYTFSGAQFSCYRPMINYEANAAGAGYQAYSVSQTLGIMDGAADICTGFYVGWTNADHSAGEIHAFGAEDITGDAQATEIAYRVGTGWDYALYAESGTVEAPTITEGGNAVYNSTETPGGVLGGTWASPTIDANGIDSDHYTAGSIDEPHLNVTNAPTDNYLLSYNSAGTNFTWVTASGGGDLLADGSVPLTANWDVGAFTITGLTFTSDQATGTAPLTVASTTVVTNLNADTVDGESASAIVTAARVGGVSANIAADGTIEWEDAADLDATGAVTAASTATAGKVELATNAETVTGTDTARAVTPDGLTDKMAAPGAIGGTTPAAISGTTGTFTGTLSGELGVTLDTTATVDLSTASNARGAMRINNDNDVIDYTLPPAEAGLNICFYSRYAAVVTIDVDDGVDVIILDGTALTAGYAIDSPGTAGDFICLSCIDATYWITLGRSGTWVDGGAD